jgi:alkylation response protein AidB-like acyl-CoA dehydrogenase
VARAFVEDVSDVLGKRHRGQQVACGHFLARLRLEIGKIARGGAQQNVADWLLQKGVDHAKERVVFDRPIGQNQGVPLARACAELEAADMICRRAAALFDAGKECGADANMAKLLASEATGTLPKRPSPLMAALPSPRNTASSANRARPVSTRPHPPRPI